MPELTWKMLLKNFRVETKERRSGILVGLCPFHQEKSPSVNYWLSGNFRCHGCGAGGDMYDWVALKFKISRDNPEVEHILRSIREDPHPDQILFNFDDVRRT